MGQGLQFELVELRHVNHNSNLIFSVRYQRNCCTYNESSPGFKPHQCSRATRNPATSRFPVATRTITVVAACVIGRLGYPFNSKIKSIVSSAVHLLASLKTWFWAILKPTIAVFVNNVGYESSPPKPSTILCNALSSNPVSRTPDHPSDSTRILS